MSTCSRHPSPAEGRETLQVREPFEDAPSSIAQDLHDLHELRKEEKCRTNSLTITTTLQKGALEQKAPEASSPWASSLVEVRFNKGLWMAQSPGDNKAPEDRLLLTKTISLGKMAEIRTHVVRGLLLAVALAIQGDFM